MSADYANDIPVALARAAHAGTSMVPEERAEQERAGYAATLTADFEALARIAGDDAAKRAILASEFARYRTGYRARSVARLSALSRCMSTMVTGPSNFPTRRNAKRNDSADKRTTELVEYRERALTAIRRELQPELRPIMAGDTDALERLRAELALLERLQTRMATANKVIRSNARRGAEAQIAALLELGIGPESNKYAGAIATVRRARPAARITSDSVTLRRLVGRTNGRGGGPRPLTRYQDVARAECSNPGAVKDIAISLWRRSMRTIEDAFDARAMAVDLGVG